MEKKWIVVPWISLLFLMLGTFLCFCSEFNVKSRGMRHIIPSLLISGIVLFCILQLKKSYAMIAASLGMLGITFFAALNMERLRKDFLVIVYYMNTRSMAYNGTDYINMRGIRGNIDSNLLVHLFGIVLAAYTGFFLFRLYHRFLGFLPIWSVLLLGLNKGAAPNKKAVFVTFTGMVLALVWISYQERGGRRAFRQRGQSGGKSKVFSYLILVAILAVGVLTANIAERKTGSRILDHSKAYLAKQHEMEREFNSMVQKGAQMFAGLFGVDSDGRLSNEEPFYTKRTVMTVTTSVRPNTALYFKGFVGGDYFNGQWNPCETEKFEKTVPDMQHQKAIWNAAYNNVKWNDTGTQFELKVQHFGMGKVSKYAYIPYYSDVGIMGENGAGCAVMIGERGLLRQEDTYYVTCYNAGDEAYDAIGSGIVHHKYSDIFADWPDAYYDYVMETYGRLRENEVPKLKALADSYRVGASDALVAAWAVQRILEENAEYSLDLEALPLGEDYAEYFLLTQHKGYCEHFATAGTLLVRALGFPARYVAGYKVTPDRFEINADGTYTARILDSDAHAWTEVFEGQYAGWFPIEMTPADSTAIMVAESPRQEEDGDETEKPEETPQPTEAGQTETPTATPQATATAAGSSNNNNSGDGMQIGNREIMEKLFQVFTVILICAAFVLSLILCVLLYQRLQVIKYYRTLRKTSKDKNAVILLRAGGFSGFLKRTGTLKAKPLLCGDGFEMARWDRIDEIVQKAEFSYEGVTAEEYEFFCDTFKRAEHTLYSKLSINRKRYLWIIGIKLP